MSQIWWPNLSDQREETMDRKAMIKESSRNQRAPPPHSGRINGGIANLTDESSPIVGVDIVQSEDVNSYLGRYSGMGRRYFAGITLRFE